MLRRLTITISQQMPPPIVLPLSWGYTLPLQNPDCYLVLLLTAEQRFNLFLPPKILQSPGKNGQSNAGGPNGLFLAQLRWQLSRELGCDS